jgi:hypothetical protein
MASRRCTRPTRASRSSTCRGIGKEIALSATRPCAWHAVAVVDADLQDPPGVPTWFARGERTHVVLMRRTSRAQETWLKKTTARAP